jgi:hypothetical protein
MNLDLDKAETNQTYKLLIGLVALRPIAWITSLNWRRQLNAARFSAFKFIAFFQT